MPLPAPHPTPYDVEIATGVAEPAPLINPDRARGAGGMVSTLDDMQTWGQALGDGRLVGAELQLERVNRSARSPTVRSTTATASASASSRAGGATPARASASRRRRSTTRSTRATIAVLVNFDAEAAAGANLNIAQEIFEALADVVATQ